ncbi:hypothetical protein [Oerskovia flava]|uniref:hypothetical protein n=1 Tax=Oerskovia flava TaxID=2986422 RepID=UPI00223F573F|nr:hypothetical protein [Oerskovia sp. JB1-3-2]
MRKYLAATAVLSTALLLTACSGDDSSSTPEDTAAPESTPTVTESTAPAVETVEITASCASFYDGGDLSLATRIDETSPLLESELDQDGVLAASTARDKISVIQARADESLLEALTAIALPYDAALSGQNADLSELEPALDELKSLCADAGYKA